MPAALVVRAVEGGELTWVLLAANGRPLARSAAAFRSADALAAAWREVVADRAALRVRLSREDGSAWWWTATLPARSAPLGAGTPAAAGAVVARSARGYLRADQCRAGASGFITALAGFARGVGERGGSGAVTGRHREK